MNVRMTKMSKLLISGDRRTGKTTALVSQVADFINADPTKRVLVVAPNISTAMRIQDSIFKKLTKDIQKRARVNSFGGIKFSKGGYVRCLVDYQVVNGVHAQVVDMIAVDEADYIRGECYDILLSLAILEYKNVDIRWVETRGAK
jgi:tRNA(Met) C34 N-acetyltransferase TmcA